MGSLVGIVTSVFLFLVYWFFIKPERDARIVRIQMLNDVKEGDYVEMLSGLRGVVHIVDNHKKTVELDCEGIILVYNKAGIAKVLQKAEDRLESEGLHKEEPNTDESNTDESNTDESNTDDQNTDEPNTDEQNQDK